MSKPHPKHDAPARFNPPFSQDGWLGGLLRNCRRMMLVCTVATMWAANGCGTTKSYEATEQLLLSEAVDDSISQIDFRPLSGFRVFLDVQYIRNIKSLGFVNSDYVISSIRQQMVGAGCLLQDKAEEADLIVEARCGTLGADSFQVTYGIPANSFIATAAQTIPGAPPVPILPDLSVARREAREGATKVAAFAYDRLSRQPVWQSGVSKASTTSRDTWVLGVGPIQTGSIRKGARWVGGGLEFGSQASNESSPRNLYERPPVNYQSEVRFEDGEPILGPRLSLPQLLETEPTKLLETEPAKLLETEPATPPAVEGNAVETLPAPPLQDAPASGP